MAMRLGPDVSTPGVFNVRSFGAKGDNVTDDSAAFQAVIDLCTGGFREIFVPAGQYIIGTSLNLTQTPYLVFRGQGVESQIHGRCVGRTIFDCAGTYGHTFEKLWIDGAETNKPQSAFLFARPVGNASAGLQTLRDVTIAGHFAKAAVISLSSEVNHYLNVNAGITTDKCVYAILEQNTIGAVSDYAAFPVTFSGGNTTHRWVGGVVNNFGTGTYGVWLTHTRDSAFTDVLFSGGAGEAAGIYIGDEAHGAIGAIGLTLSGCSAEWAGTYGIWIDENATLQDSALQGIFYKGVRGSTGSVVQSTMFSGVWYQSPSIDVDTMYDCTVSNRLGVTVHTESSGNSFWNSQSVSGTDLVLPANTTGTQYGEKTVRSDGQTVHTRHIADKSIYDRVKMRRAHADMFRTTVQRFSPATGAITIAEKSGGVCSFDLTGDVTINLSQLMAPFPAGNDLWDEGCVLTFVFKQDSTGGRTVTLNPASFAIPPGWNVDTNPSATSTIEFVLDCGQWKWVAKGMSTSKPALIGDIRVQNLSAPPVVYLSTTTGTLGTGDYYYKVTAVSATGESLPSLEYGWNLTSTGGVRLTWPSVPGAVSYKVYGRVATVEQYMATTGDLTWVDDGSITPSGALPTINTGSSLTVDGLLIHGSRKISQGSAAPSTGTWAVGDIVYNTSPAPSGYVGWICTTAGTPGTWKGFGAIEA